jgi:hypothetical protein
MSGRDPTRTDGDSQTPADIARTALDQAGDAAGDVADEIDRTAGRVADTGSDITDLLDGTRGSGGGGAPEPPDVPGIVVPDITPLLDVVLGVL